MLWKPKHIHLCSETASHTTAAVAAAVGSYELTSQPLAQSRESEMEGVGLQALKSCPQLHTNSNKVSPPELPTNNVINQSLRI